MTIDPKLLDPIVTTQQAAVFIDAIDRLAGEIYSTNQKWRQAASQILTQGQLAIVEDLILANQITDNQPVSIEKVLTTLKDTLVHSPELTLTIATDLPLNNLIAISSWFREQTGGPVLLNIKIDPGILGGTVIEHQGKLKDYSLKQQLEDYFASKPLTLND